MNQILLTGGTGTLGREIIKQLLSKNYVVSVISSNNKPDLPEQIKVIHADLTKKESIPADIKNATVIIHSASNPANAQSVDLEGTRNLLAAIDKGHTKHFIYVSIAGVDKSSYPYYQVKREVEKMIQASAIPFTILRATQFHDFVLHRMIRPFDSGPGSVLKIPKGLQFQSIDKKEVVYKILDLIADDALCEIVTIGGPKVQTLEEMAQIYLDVLDRKDNIEAEKMESERLAMLSSGINLCPDHTYGGISWRQFITNSLKDDTI